MIIRKLSFQKKINKYKILLLPFEEGCPAVIVLYYRGVPGPTFIHLGVPVSWSHGPTFIPCRVKGQCFSINVIKVVFCEWLWEHERMRTKALIKSCYGKFLIKQTLCKKKSYLIIWLKNNIFGTLGGHTNKLLNNFHFTKSRNMLGAIIELFLTYILYAVSWLRHFWCSSLFSIYFFIVFFCLFLHALCFKTFWTFAFQKYGFIFPDISR